MALFGLVIASTHASAREKVPSAREVWNQNPGSTPAATSSALRSRRGMKLRSRDFRDHGCLEEWMQRAGARGMLSGMTAAMLCAGMEIADHSREYLLVRQRSEEHTSELQSL